MEPNAIQLMEKISKKLIDAFKEINDMCRQATVALPSNQSNQTVRKQEDNHVPTPREIHKQPSNQLAKKKESKVAQPFNVDDMIQTFEVKEAPIADKPKQKQQKAEPPKEVIKEPPKAKKTKNKVEKQDPNIPKKPPGSYLMFQKDYKPKIVQDNPSMPLSEQAKVLGRQWKKLDSAEKLRYQNMYKAAKKAYEEEMGEYKKNHPDYEQPRRKRKPETQKETQQEASCILSQEHHGADMLDMGDSLGEDL